MNLCYVCVRWRAGESRAYLLLFCVSPSGSDLCLINEKLIRYQNSSPRNRARLWDTCQTSFKYCKCVCVRERVWVKRRDCRVVFNFPRWRIITGRIWSFCSDLRIFNHSLSQILNSVFCPLSSQSLPHTHRHTYTHTRTHMHALLQLPSLSLNKVAHWAYFQDGAGYVIVQPPADLREWVSQGEEGSEGGREGRKVLKPGFSILWRRLRRVN